MRKMHSSSSVTAWPSKGLTKGKLSWKTLKLFFEMGQEPICWKELVPEASHVHESHAVHSLEGQQEQLHGPTLLWLMLPQAIQFAGFPLATKEVSTQ